jgi:hypothetical protein
MEPFQIFCLGQRPRVAQQNPEMTAPELTSLIAHMWRSLSANERQGYFDVAIEFFNGRQLSPPKRKRRRSPSSPALAMLLPNDEDLLALDHAPAFAIIPRGSSGSGAARASEQSMFAAPESTRSLNFDL